MNQNELMLFDLIEKLNSVIIEIYRESNPNHRLEHELINLQRSIGNFRSQIMKEKGFNYE